MDPPGDKPSFNNNCWNIVIRVVIHNFFPQYQLFSLFSTTSTICIVSVAALATQQALLKGNKRKQKEKR